MGIENLETRKYERLGKSELSTLKDLASTPLERKDNTNDSLMEAVPSVVGELKTKFLEIFRIGQVAKLEILYDAEVKEKIAEYLSGVQELKYESWKEMSLKEREELLQKIEREIAAIEHRPHLSVKVEKMDMNNFGYQSSLFKKIALNSVYVGSNRYEDYLEVVDTIIHEGRHAYQHFNVERKLIHESASVVNTWRQNFYDPKYGYFRAQTCVIPIKGRQMDVGFRLYYYQPVETDARDFAAGVMLKLKQRGFL